MKGITRIPGGFLARHYWGKKDPLSAYFYDREYKSEEAAEAAAGSWLERIAKEYPAPLVLRRPGICFTWDRNGSGLRTPCVEVFWTSYPDKKKHTKKFTYHNDLEKIEAERRARNFLEARKKDLKEYEKTVRPLELPAGKG